jgi:hypothetical protein
VTGLLPYSRLATSPAQSIALEPTEVFFVTAIISGELTRECPELTYDPRPPMLDRARDFTTSELHDEKMISLGRLSAGSLTS